MTPMTIAAALLDEIRVQRVLYRDEANWARLHGKHCISPARSLGALGAIERIAYDALARESADLDDVLLATAAAKNECFYLSTSYLRDAVLASIGG